ncbi:MAG: hypothetical protein BWY00_01726 [Firmicutes bacterium ADurb.Bin153]|nr:MAG: hypothetical protein BWY00_01726 [Firmicutes bacterium ADurb.Bin153]
MAASSVSVTVPADPEQFPVTLPVMFPEKAVADTVPAKVTVASPKVIVGSVPPEALNVQTTSDPAPQVVVPISVVSTAMVKFPFAPASVKSMPVPSARSLSAEREPESESVTR